MNKGLQQIISEFLWLVLCIGLAILTVSLLYNCSLMEETIDIHLHDTMYVLNRWHILVPTCLFFIFFIYFVKVLRNSFSRNLPNTLLIITGFAFVISLTWLTRLLSPLSGGGWTVYPPLSALGENYPAITQDPATELILNFIGIVQIVIVSLLIFIAYRWGRSKIAK